MAIRIQLRKDHPNVWDSADPTLAAGEFGFAWDSADSASFGRLKIGDGTSTWTNLPYFYSAGDSAGNYASAGGGSAGIAWGGDRGLFFGGRASGIVYDTIDYIDITTSGNATDFGNLTTAIWGTSSASNGTYAISGQGRTSTNTYPDFLDYVTVATAANATSFGTNLSTVDLHLKSATSDGTYGLWSGGGLTVNTIEYITIATSGSMSDFGDLTEAATQNGAFNDATYSVFAGGYNTDITNFICYVTTATPSNATDFGDLNSGSQSHSGTSDSTRGLFFGGYEQGTYAKQNNIQYVTIATPSNATDFGDLSAALSLSGAVSNGTYGVVGGGSTNTYTNTIESVTIQTTSNSTDFGDLTAARDGVSGASGSSS